jgi:hypothetical protein
MKFNQWLENKKPKPKTEKHPCPDCGKDAETTYHGINPHSGHEQTVTKCSNPNCPSKHGGQNISDVM